MSGPLTAAWALGLGVLTAAGAWFTGCAEATAAPETAPTKEETP